jgi:hypothetical protein
MDSRIFQSDVVKFCIPGLLSLSILFIWGCSDDPATPEEQLRQTIAEAEAYLQDRNLSASMNYVHPDYQDKRGLDIRQLRAMLAGYFIRHQSIYILTRIEQLDLNKDGEAQVLLFAGLAGSPQDRSPSLSHWRGDLIRLDLKFVLQGGEWLLRQADWRRAGPEDFY